MLANMVPIDVPTFRENKYHGLAIVSQIRLAVFGRRTEIILVSFVEGCNRSVRGLSILVFRLVVEQCNLEVVFACALFQKSKVMIRIRPAFAIPIDDESRDSHTAGVLNLPAKNGGILAGVAHIHVGVVAKPWHVDGEKLRGDCRRRTALQ